MPRRKLSAERADPWATPDPPLTLAERQRDWYGTHRDRARISYQVTELLVLVVSAVTTLAAALTASPWVTASLAAGTLVLTGLRRVWDWHGDWVAFSVAWSDLQTAIYEYRLVPEDRRDEELRHGLVDRLNQVISGETGRWAVRRQKMERPG